MPRLKFKGRDGKLYRIPTLQDIRYKQTANSTIPLIEVVKI